MVDRLVDTKELSVLSAWGDETSYTRKSYDAVVGFA